MNFIVEIVSGLTIGCIYGLVAIGFSMIFRAMGLVNFAQGDLMMLGGFVGYTCLSVVPQMPFPLVVLLAMLIVGAIGFCIERIVLRPAVERNASAIYLVLLTLGIGIVLSNAARLIWGANPVVYKIPLAHDIVQLGGYPLPEAYFYIIGFVTLLLIALNLFFGRTWTGLILRATAQDPATATLFGVNNERASSLAFALASAIAAAGGVLYAPLFFVSFDMGTIGLKAFAATAIGTLGSVPGAAVGGLLIGVIETLGGQRIGPEFQDSLAFGTMILVLMLRPHGLFATARSGRRAVVEERTTAVPRRRPVPSIAPPPASIHNDIPESEASRASPWLAFAAVMIPLWVLPPVLGSFTLYMGAIVAVFATAALGLQVMVGLAGQLSLGHAAFLGVGAYVSVLLQKNYGLPFALTAFAGTAAAAGAGLLMAQLIRLSGVYFKIATFGFGIVVYQLMTNLSSVTGGFAGVIGIPPIRLFGYAIHDKLSLFVLAMSFLTIAYLALLRLTDGRVGRAFRALGMNETAARSVGVPIVRYKMSVIVIGCAIAGFSGTLIPHIYNFLNPEDFTWLQSLLILIMITIGGLGSLPGAVIGAVLLLLIPEYLRSLAEYKMLGYGILLILSMMFMPGGITGWLASVFTRFKTRRAQ
jgi:branched-chain amino acid transport system permease protein